MKIHFEFSAAILGITIFIFTDHDRSFASVRDREDVIWINAFLDQKCAHCVAASGTKSQIISIWTALIAMSLHEHIDIWVASQIACHFSCSAKIFIAFDHVAVIVKMDIAECPGNFRHCARVDKGLDSGNWASRIAWAIFWLVSKHHVATVIDIAKRDEVVVVSSVEFVSGAELTRIAVLSAKSAYAALHMPCRSSRIIHYIIT